MEFKKATRSAVKLKLAISGPSGSGKTWGSLEIAKGLGGRVAVIDTENQSASLYADRFEFDHLCLSPPFTVDKFLDAIKAAVSANYDVLIIDSISHEWAADGGILDQKTQIDLRGSATGGKSNQFTNWAKPSAEHERFRAGILQAPIHTIATMRSKMEYDISDGKPKKIGLAPIQREGMEYEFSVVFDVSINHDAMASKDRTSMFDQQHFRLTPEIGKRLAGWLASGATSSLFKTEPEFLSEETRRREVETIYRQARFESGSMKGQFMEAADVEYLKKFRDHLQTVVDGGRSTPPNLAAIEAANWWITHKQPEATK